MASDRKRPSAARAAPSDPAAEAGRSETSAPAPAEPAAAPPPVPVPPPASEPFYDGAPPDPDSQNVLAADHLDRMVSASMARLTMGISPASLNQALSDWAINLASSPGKQIELAQYGWRKAVRFGFYAAHALAGQAPQDLVEPERGDKRFDGEGWDSPPFNLYKQGFLLTQQWWQRATTGVRGVSGHHEKVTSFVARQALDLWAPTNFLATNPQLLQATREQGGTNLLRGFENLMQDVEARVTGERPKRAHEYRPGREVAVTPGRVVYRNRLIELIQYAPRTERVRPEPILVVPAWIMKYYILDLSPEKSLIRYLTEQGFTVFAISWKNPDSEDRHLGMQDYLDLGLMAALDAVEAICGPDNKVHALGYCLGGTLLSIGAAAMARDGDERLKTVSLLAAQTDFTEPGELSLFIDAGQLAFLKDMMWSQGYLDTKQMAGAFQLLRPNDLIYSRLLHEYFFGVREDKNDLMAWNDDATRMPYRMHAEYLEQLFQENRLARGQYRVGEEPVALTDIEVPIFAVGTQRDHVAPWKSVYKIHLLVDVDVTFLLTSGGHNGGIVTPPGHPRRIYQVATAHDGQHYRDPDRWQQETPVHKGSWWPEWAAWLAARSGACVAPPPLGRPELGYAPLEAAPGTYVHQR
jgi:polyhydroxyalkanoate synthase